MSKYPRTVLVVDDMATQREQIRKMLVSAGINMLEAHDGETGVKAATEQKPDLILMDVVMPGLNGFQATRQIKGASATAGIPIIMITTKDRAPDKENARENGASEYLVKPIEADHLLATIERVWAQRPVAA